MPGASSIELEAVILSSDSELTQRLAEILRRSDVEVITFDRSGTAKDYVSNRKVDAVIVDSEIEDGIDFLKSVRETKSNDRTATFVVIPSRDLYPEVAAAAHFIIDKPFLVEAFERALRVAHGMMLRERRRYFRVPIRIPLTVTRGDDQVPFKGTSLNISENGMALRAELPLCQRELVQLNFNLPSVSMEFCCPAEVVWADSEGLGGVHFLSLGKATKRLLTSWIHTEFERESGAVPVSG
jgi:DNA-binding response OmpR family regulator